MSAAFEGSLKLLGLPALMGLDAKGHGRTGRERWDDADAGPSLISAPALRSPSCAALIVGVVRPML